MKRVALVALALASAILAVLLLTRSERVHAADATSPEPAPLLERASAPLELQASPSLEPSERTPIRTVHGKVVEESIADRAISPSSEFSVRFHGIVLDGSTGRPIAAAKASAPGVGGPAYEAISDAGGRFVLVVGAQPRLRMGSLQAEGYGPGAFVLDHAHDSPQNADEIELLPAAGLEVRVRAPDRRPLEGCEVKLVWPGELVTRSNSVLHESERASWVERTDAAGLARFEQLPAEIALEWTVGDSETAHREGRIALEPGARGSLEVELGSGARLAGRVRDETGSPVAGLELGLGHGDLTAGKRGRFEVETGDGGRYVFEGLAYDTYVLGLRRPEGDLVLRGEERVTVDRAVVEHDLEVVHGLFLSGRVVGTPEEIQALDHVRARRPGTDGTSQIVEGTFRIGPLPPGEYLVSASNGDTATAVVRATAGADDVELPVLARREVGVHIEGGGGEVELVLWDEERELGQLWSEDDARFSVALAPGHHALRATTWDGLVAFVWLDATPVEPHGEVLLRLEPGARCTFHLRTASGVRTLRLSSRGEPFPILEFGGAGEALLPGASRVLLVPPGDLVVELLDGERVDVREELVVRPGEHRRIELAPR